MYQESDVAKATCTYGGCTRPHLARGLCRAHYQRWTSHGDPGHGGPLNRRRSSLCGDDGCDEPVTGGGFCNRHYRRVRKTGTPAGVAVRNLPDEERFWHHVDVRTPSECWPWTKWRDRQNYGRTRFEGVQRPAPRVAWQLAHNARILPEYVTRHDCDNPPCCNPGHLSLGTHADNIRDRDERGRTARNSVPGIRGELNYNVKLSTEQVHEIRATLCGVRGELTALARAYDVSPRLIALIRDGNARTHE